MFKSILNHFGSKSKLSESDSHSPSGNCESDNLLSQSCEIEQQDQTDDDTLTKVLYQISSQVVV